MIIYLIEILSANDNVLKYNWMVSPANYLNSRIDSTTNPYSLLLETYAKKGIIFCLIPLPEINKSKIDIKINYKTQDCEALYLKLETIGSCEVVTGIDTFCLNNVDGWATYDVSIYPDNSQLLNLSIEIIGDRGRVWIDTMDLYVNGRDIHEFSFSDKEKDINLKKKDFISLKKANVELLPFLNKKILSIGETIHGTETMNDVGIEVIKNRILTKNCKIVLLEIPLESSFYINRFIDGDPNFTLEYISTYFENLLYSHSFIDLIEWIKKYNKLTKEKVYFLGFDMNYIQMKGLVDLTDFFYTLNIGRDVKELKQICSLLIEINTPIENILAIFDLNNGFENILNINESKLLRYSLLKVKENSRTNFRFIQRDTIMYENTNFMINNLLKPDETVTIFCHIGHSNYLDQGRFIFGYYMKNAYKDQYSCIALVAEAGTFLVSKDSSFFGIERLQSSPCNSIEYFLNKLNADSCYLAMENLNCEIFLKIRSIGNFYIDEQFKYVIPKARMDGVIFIKQVSAIRKSKDVLDKNLDMRVLVMSAYSRVFKKIKEMQ